MTDESKYGSPRMPRIETDLGPVYVPKQSFELGRMVLGQGPAFGQVERNRVVVIGMTIEVSERFVRRIMVESCSGAVVLESLTGGEQLVHINTSVDRLVSSLHLYESWHERLLNMPYEAALLDARIADAARELKSIDPGRAESSVGDLDWWFEKVTLIGRLI